MVIKYLIAGPAFSLAGFATLMFLEFGVLSSIGISWVIGCAAIAAVVVYQVYFSAASKITYSSIVEPLKG